MPILHMPVAPKVPQRLDMFNDIVEDYVDADQMYITDLDEPGITAITLDSSRLEHSILTGLQFRHFAFTDVACSKLEAVALKVYKGQLLRVTIADSRFTGADFAESSFTDCTFQNMKLDDVGFRFATFSRVRFVNCVLNRADFSNATFTHVSFVECEMVGTNFVSAHCNKVDLTGVTLTDIHGLLGLKGSTISSEQLIQVAPLLASELGFDVEA